MEEGEPSGLSEETGAARIWDVLEPRLDREGLELVFVECLKMKTRFLVRIFIDKPGGVTMDDCVEMSGRIGDVLDVHDLPPGPYTLEVSSPGLDRPLFRDKDFRHFRGRTIRVRTREKIAGSRNFQGTLLEYVEEQGHKVILLERSGEEIRIPREAVLKANVVYDEREE